MSGAFSGIAGAWEFCDDMPGEYLSIKCLLTCWTEFVDGVVDVFFLWLLVRGTEDREGSKDGIGHR